jgi:recombination protein RecR
MDIYSGHINKLIEQLSRLPGVGAKSAQRLAFHIINMPKEEVEGIANAMISAKEHIHYCKECYTLTDEELCPICKDPNRNHKQIMVVEQTRDMAAYEKTGKYEGVYHVLHGAISPMLGIGPEDIKLKELMRRLEAAGVKKSVTGLVLPTGYSFNLDCTNIYLALCIIFLSQAFNIPLTIEQQLFIILILMVTSKGAVGVTGSGFIVLAGTLGAMGGAIPVVTVAVLLGVDKFMSEMRAVGNLCGNAVAAVVVGVWDKKIDMEKFQYALNNPDKIESVIGSKTIK